jgi:ribose transport system substrate-binding protein
MNLSERRHRVPAVSRATRVLDALAAADRPCSLAELSAALGAPKSSVLGVCQALTEERLIIRGVDGTYARGPRLFELASVARTHGQPLRKVGFTYPQHEAFFLAERGQLEIEADARGIAVDIRCADRSIASQIADIRGFVANAVDLILVEPVMSEGLEEVLSEAKAAQITVVAVGSSTSGADAVVSTDNAKAGALAAVLLARVLGRQGTVAVVDGIAITANADRISGFLGVMAEHPGISTLIGARGALNEDSGQAAAREVLASGNEIDGIFAANDQIALGIAKVLTERGRPVPIVSVDGAAQAIEQIRAGGPIVGTAAQDPRRLATVALELGSALRSGSGRAQHAVFLPPRIVDRTNVEDYQAWE